MTIRDQKLIVSRLPRAMFLAHSEHLVAHLLNQATLDQQAGLELLEIGCGPRSPLVPILRRTLRQPFRLHQIDARPDAVQQARKWNPEGVVDQMYIHDMSSIPDQSKDLVIGMSVFDQNPTSMLGRFAQEIHRVLKPNGIAIYVHNEELNAPATTASYLNTKNPMYLLPSTQWQPFSDSEYCLAAKHDIDRMLTSLASSTEKLREYIRTMMPPTSSLGSAKVQVPAIGKMTPHTINQVRVELANLESQGLKTVSKPTGQLLARHVEGQLFCERNGFRIQIADMFEMRRCNPWKSWFAKKPDVKCFVRGIARFGVAAEETIPISAHNQSLNVQPSMSDNEVLLAAYQYGLVTRKTP